MKILTSFIKSFDKEFIQMLILNSVVIGFVLLNLYEFSVEKAFMLAPLVCLAILAGLIGFVHILSA